MELSKPQNEYLLARECGTPHQKKMTAILRTAIAALKNTDKPTGVAVPFDFEAEIERLLKLAWF